MEKYLVTIEFRYFQVPVKCCATKNKIITIGIYDDFDEACVNGNNILEKLESRFEIHIFPDGQKANKKRLGGCFGGKNDLITKQEYLKTPFEFYLKIETLKYDSIDETIDDAVKSVERYIKYLSCESD